MHIDRLLDMFERNKETDKETLLAMMGNHISHYLGDDNGGAAICSKKFDQLAEDILVWAKRREERKALKDNQSEHGEDK